MRQHLFGGRVRVSTLIIALVFLIALVTYLLVRPVPASIAQKNQTPKRSAPAKAPPSSPARTAPSSTPPLSPSVSHPSRRPTPTPTAPGSTEPDTTVPETTSPSG
jgi:hypothetical protein